MPEKAKLKLSGYGSIAELETSGITYEAVSGHPDIFFFQSSSKKLITAPNLPEKYVEILNGHGVLMEKGECPVGKKYPATALYNAAASENYFIHNLSITDKQVLASLSDRRKINIRQGYCRCNLLPLRDDSFITSDPAIFKELVRENLRCLYTDPDEIILPGFSHGFFGGACGIYENEVFIAGSLNYLKSGSEIRTFLKSLNYNITELYEGPLFDGGSLLFL